MKGFEHTMKRSTKMGVLSLGGLALFSASFLGSAILEGASPWEFLERSFRLGGTEREHRNPAPPSRSIPAPPSPGAPIASDEGVLGAQLGLMASYVLEPAFSDGQMQKLADEIAARSVSLDRREADLDLRATDLDERLEVLEEQRTALEAMRGQLEENKRDLLLVHAEFELDRRGREELAHTSLGETAGLFTTGDIDDLARRLLMFPPEEAAVILDALHSDRAVTLLNALPNDAWKTYQAAYATRQVTGS